ncbi:AMP-binding enzyme [Halorientalis persicus]|uniref:AMP-binding enzyme n=1 Tax=Halorientalis persicus TaxID=1367881 RepID=A0A1H8MX41_9EURY|nr:AMP-binding enzyme [Halorientalis persicus]
MNFATELELQARSQPDAPALFFEDQTFTWSEIDDRASQFVNVLTAHGLGPGDHMAIYMPNVPAFIFGFYGAMKAGVVPMPLNLRFEQGEVEYMIVDLLHGLNAVESPHGISGQATGTSRFQDVCVPLVARRVSPSEWLSCGPVNEAPSVAESSPAVF